QARAGEDDEADDDQRDDRDDDPPDQKVEHGLTGPLSLPDRPPRRVQLRGGAPRAVREAYSLYVERADEGAVPPQMGPSRQLPDRPPRRVQLRGGAPRAAREAYSLYVERAAEGANEADGPLSAACYCQLVPLILISPSGTALYP